MIDNNTFGSCPFSGKPCGPACALFVTAQTGLKASVAGFSNMCTFGAIAFLLAQLDISLKESQTPIQPEIEYIFDAEEKK